MSSDVSFSDEELTWLISGMPINSSTKATAVPNFKLRELLDSKKELERIKTVEMNLVSLAMRICLLERHPNSDWQPEVLKEALLRVNNIMGIKEDE